MNKHGGYFGDKKEKIIDFSVNINPLGVPTKLIECIKKELPMLINYPEIDGKTYKEILCKYLNISVNQIILGNGATELIYLFARAVQASKVLIIQPTFTEYVRAFQITGSKIYNFYTDENKNFTININELLNNMEKIKPEVVVLCNPNNPTGTFYNKEQLIPLLNYVKDNKLYMFVDESFIDFTNKPSLTSYINEYPIFILRSMTKIYGIPGLRLGYGLSNENIISKLNYIKEPWTVNNLALEAVKVLLEDEDYINRTKLWYKEEKGFLLKGLLNIDNIKVFPSETNFFLCKLKNILGKDLKQQLLKENIYIRTCEDFSGLSDKFIRVAVRSRRENKKLISSLNKNIK